jgi:hypothetical protein|tara:strand:+ start:83 stop:526 length:444 start_codon:yes stop_codon:yes gene_type:complete
MSAYEEANLSPRLQKGLAKNRMKKQFSSMADNMSNMLKQEQEYRKFLSRHKVKESWDYNYKGAFLDKVIPNKEGKWPSKFKHPLSSERYEATSKGWLDTLESDRQGKNVYSQWQEVLTQEMKRGDLGFNTLQSPFKREPGSPPPGMY